MTAQTVADRTSVADSGAPVATSSGTEPLTPENVITTMPSSATTPATPTSTVSGATAGRSAPGDEPPSSKPLAAPSSGSNKRWRQPRSVREFAAQVNAMATAVLNGEVSGDGLEAARLYAGLARTVAQAMTTEVQRARFLGLAPELNFENPEDEA